MIIKKLIDVNYADWKKRVRGLVDGKREYRKDILNYLYYRRRLANSAVDM